MKLNLDVLKPVSGLQIGEPVGVLNIGVDHILQLAERLSHHMDIVNIHEDQLSILICIFTFIPSSFHLKENTVLTLYLGTWQNKIMLLNIIFLF